MDHRVTRLLAAIGAGKKDAIDELLPTVYAELRRIARVRMARETPGQTLQPTALVHEAYLRLVGDPHLEWKNRSHFYAAAAEAMRRILIERARRYSREKHGGKLRRSPLEEVPDAGGPQFEDLLALDEALRRLEARDPQMGSVVKLRFFAGLTVPETAQALQISPRTVNRLWIAARAWLGQAMERPSGGSVGVHE